MLFVMRISCRKLRGNHSFLGRLESFSKVQLTILRSCFPSFEPSFPSTPLCIHRDCGFHSILLHRPTTNKIPWSINFTAVSFSIKQLKKKFFFSLCVVKFSCKFSISNSMMRKSNIEGKFIRSIGKEVISSLLLFTEWKISEHKIGF